MTREEERKNDRKILAQCRARKRAVSKKINGMSSEEVTAYFDKRYDEIIAEYELRTGKKWDDIPYCGVKPPPTAPASCGTINP
jgi:hypothetical protein